MRGFAHHVQGFYFSTFVFLDLGTLVIFLLSPLLPLCFSCRLYATPFCVHGFLISFSLCLFSGLLVVWLFIFFVADLAPYFSPSLLDVSVRSSSFFSAFTPPFPLPRVYQYRLGPPSSDYRIASYPSLLCYNQIFLVPFPSDVYGAILVFRCIIGPSCMFSPFSLLIICADRPF